MASPTEADARMVGDHSEVAMAISPEVLEPFLSADWDTLHPQLTWHAMRELQKRRWRLDRHSPTDIVNAAINGVLVGKRKWDPTKDADLLVYLKTVVNSIVGHLPDEAGWVQRLRDMQDLTAAAEAELERHGGGDPSPEAQALQEELDAESEAAFWNFHASLADDPFVQKIVESIYEGEAKRETIADRLGVPLNDFDNARRRLKDRLTKAFPKAAAIRAKRR